MRIQTAALLAALLPSLTLANAPALDAKAITNAEGLRDQAMRGSDAYAIVESLTTEVGPRMGGSPEYDRATAWAQEKFKALGFDKVWLQPVTFPVWQRHAESGRVLSPFPQRLVLTALGGSESTRGPLAGEVVEFASLDALKAAPEGALNGKIAFVNLKMLRSKDGSGYGPASNVRRSGASEAAKKGAVAIVIRSVGTDSDRLPHTGMMRYEPDVAKIPAAALSVPDADLLANMLKRGKPVKIELNIDAGFTGHVTLELSNVATLPIKLWPGMKIGQLCFFRLTSPAENPYGSGPYGNRYQGQRGPTASRSFQNFHRTDVGVTDVGATGG